MYIFPHNKNWRLEFEKEREKIITSIDFNIRLHHIGSTAVEGLYAKDCIDILGEVKNIKQVKSAIKPLENLGYIYRGEYGIDGREYFSKPVRKAHLHIFQQQDPNIARHLNFVRQLQSDGNLVIELNELKLELHRKYPSDKSAYQEEKSDFYKRF